MTDQSSAPVLHCPAGSAILVDPGPAGDHRIVALADGKIVKLLDLPSADEEMPGGPCISIFLNLFDVHVTRAPIGGCLERLEHKRGRFKVAFDEEASRVYEQNVLTIRSGRICVVVKQIAGLFSRRGICWKQPGYRPERLFRLSDLPACRLSGFS